MANGKEVKSKKVTSKDDWEYNFTDLPKYSNGKVIKYTITEDNVTDYTTKVNGYNLINIHMPETTKITVKKSWNDSNNQDGIRANSVRIHLYANGKDTGKYLDLTESNNWNGIFENLDVYKVGQKIEYTIKEDTDSGYTSQITGDSTSGFIVTNTHTLETTSISGIKTWKDNDNQDGKRPDFITVRLLANGKEVDSKKITSKDGWEYNFTDLPKYSNGKAIIYTVKEDAVPNYSTSIDGYNLTNSYTPGKTSVSVTKAWNDGNNQDGIRPNGIKVQLYADGIEKGKAVELTLSNNWSYTFKDLPLKSHGQEIQYTVKEVGKIMGYESSVSGNAKNGFTITNTHIPEVTSISGTKTWDDNDNQDGKRPDSITVRLLANGKEVDNKTVTEGNGWKYSFTNLPKYENGQAIVYTVTEDSVENYSTSISGYDLTNRYTPEKTSITVSKSWNDSNNQDGIRAKSVRIHLYANGEDTGKYLDLTKDTDWNGIFSDLDVYKSSKKIEYTITEDSVSGYTSKVSGDSTSGFIVTNTHKVVVPSKKDKTHTHTGVSSYTVYWFMLCILSLGMILVLKRYE